MKFQLALPIFVSSVAAFAPQPMGTKSSSLNAYPTVNGWTADESEAEVTHGRISTLATM